MEFEEQFLEKSISELCKNYDIIKGWNVNLCRASADFIDGLKQVARRLLYIMFLKDNGKSYRKVAAITGDTIARIHMHGPSSVYSCLVGLAQEWNNNIPLIDGYGNFGSIAGDPAGADRYIQARISEYAYDCFFSDWKEAAVDMVMGADGETKEPLYLPAKYPNILLNGIQGIGYGMATNIPSYNFKEIVQATIKLIKDPKAEIVLIPDSPTGCNIIKTDFKKITNSGVGNYRMRSTFEIDSDKNEIKITSVPYQVPVNSIREQIASIKEKGGLPELVAMNDHSGAKVDLRLTIKAHINPYKFLKKLLKEVSGLEKSFSVNISVTNDFMSFDLSIKEILLQWIKYRCDQKRVVISNKRTNLLYEQRINDIKLFIMNKNNLEKTIAIFKNGLNRKTIEKTLIETYRNSSIKMDSLQAQALSEMKMYELSKESYEKYLAKKEELIKEIAKVEAILNEENGITNIIINELTEGAKKFGSPRKSNVVPEEINSTVEIDSYCILQISDGIVNRTAVTNVDEEPIPNDPNGFAIKAEDQSQFIVIDENGLYSFIKVNEIPLNMDVPLVHFMHQKLGKVVAIISTEDLSRTCLVVTKQGFIKAISLDAFSPNRTKPCLKLKENDKIIKGILLKQNNDKDLLIYTKEGFGQRFNFKTTSKSSGNPSIILSKGDEVCGCFVINGKEKDLLLYITSRGKVRLNLSKYLPQRNSIRDEKVNLIPLSSTDSLVAVIACNQFDEFRIFLDDFSVRDLKVSELNPTTMSSEPEQIFPKGKKVVKIKLK